MNLITYPWIPVRDARGQTHLIAPHELTRDIDSNPLLQLDAVRPDFNGALAQFLIGLVQTAWVLGGKPWDREQMLAQPPSPDELEAAFAPLIHVFELDGEGPRFMQDLTLSEADKPAENGVAALLIESPGEQASERNTDHFIKRDQAGAMCVHCVAMALFTLMTNAPSGGAGHRTSLRGGGPLTTVLLYEPDLERDPDAPPPALWRDIASNVREPQAFLAGSDPSKSEPWHVFPWLAPIERTQPGAETQPLDTHPLQMYWAMPRRIRLQFAAATGACELCGATDRPLVSRYVTKKHGLNYEGPWRHPLSPYCVSKPGEPPLPMHPQRGGLGYKHWLGWVLGIEQKGRHILPAAVVRDLLLESASAPFRLWAFGYDMDKMKARCWYESRFPLFEFPPGESGLELVRLVVECLLESAEFSANCLRWAVRDAWLGEADARGDLSFIEASFWSGTEADFFVFVRDACTHVRQQPDFGTTAALRENWLHRLRREALSLFDLHVASGPLEAAHPERIAAAHRTLCSQLWRDKLRAAAKLPNDKPAAKGRTGKLTKQGVTA